MVRFQAEQIKGVIPALLTPFDEKEELDATRLRRLVDHLISKGVDAFYVTGGTGEGLLMTPEERKRVVEVVVDQAAGRVPVVAHIGAISTRISIDLARHAAKTGVDAIASIPPFYWMFDHQQIFEYFRDIAEATALPLIVYNISRAALVPFEQLKVISTIESVRGIKYTDTAHFEIMRMKQEIGDGFLVYSGCDEMAISGLLYGADGIIGSYYNLMPELFKSIYQAANENDWVKAAEKQRIANIIIMHANKLQCVAVIKRALGWMGVDGGYCRKPLVNFAPDREVYLKEEFKRLREQHNITGVEFLDAI